MERINRLLLRVGVPASTKGFSYLREALELAEKDSGILEHGGLHGRIYPTIARRHGGSTGSVERCIREAIENAFGRMPVELQEELFGNSLAAGRGKATNREFLAVLVLELKDMGMG